MEQYFWLIAFLVLIVLEALTMGLTTIWFAGGALVAFLIRLMGGSILVQILVFLIVSVVLLLFTRPLAKKYFNNSRIKTNAESLIGELGVVIEEINTLKAQGRVDVKGQEWAAKTEMSEGIIAKGSTVVVKEIRGVHLIVDMKEKE